jgi:ribosomal protein S27E
MKTKEEILKMNEKELSEYRNSINANFVNIDCSDCSNFLYCNCFFNHKEGWSGSHYE